MRTNAGKRGLRFGVALAICAVLWQAACDGRSSSSGEKVTPTESPATASMAISVSVNDAPLRTMRVPLGADGFSDALLEHLGVEPKGRWASAIVTGEHGAKLMISLRHYPDAVLALQTDPTTNARRAGLRSKDGLFMQGFVALSPLQISLYDSGHLSKGPAPATPLQIRFAGGAPPLEITEENFSTLELEALPGKSSKKARWASLAAALDHAGIDAASAKSLAMYAKSEGEPELVVPASEIFTLPSHLHLKLNRKGEWKLDYSPPDREARVLVITHIEVR